MLMDIKGYLAGKGFASLSQIARKLSADPDAVRPMLEHWLRKGKIRRVKLATRCHGCTSCAPPDLEFYEWTALPPESSRSEHQSPHAPEQSCRSKAHC